MSAAPIDYDSLAAAGGGSAAVDYDALASQHGGTAAASPTLADNAHAEMRAHPQGVRAWLDDLEGDLRYGQSSTVVGRALKAIGYQGTSSIGGMEGNAGETIASPILGPAHAAVGLADLASGNLKQGAGEVASGALQAATLPAAFVAPEGAEALAKGAGKATQAISELIPSAERAGGKFQQVMSAAKEVPVQLDNSQDSILKLMDWQKKTQLGPTINKFLNRVTNPKLPPLTYEEARDFQQLLGKLSADESIKMAPAVKRDLTQMVVGLKQDVGNAAEVVGKGEDYYSAMNEYRKYAKLGNLKQTAKDLLTKETVKGVAKGLGVGAGGAVAYKFLSDLQ